MEQLSQSPGWIKLLHDSWLVIWDLSFCDECFCDLNFCDLDLCDECFCDLSFSRRFSHIFHLIFYTVPEQKSVTILSILIRLCIFLLIGIFLRLTCIFCGCCKGGFRFPWRGREEEDSVSQTPPSSGTHSVAGSLTRERRSFNDTPPPYPGTPVSRIVRTLLGPKSETPPPSYKQAVKFKHDSPNTDDVSSKESAWMNGHFFEASFMKFLMKISVNQRSSTAPEKF